LILIVLFHLDSLMMHLSYFESLKIRILTLKVRIFLRILILKLMNLDKFGVRFVPNLLFSEQFTLFVKRFSIKSAAHLFQNH